MESILAQLHQNDLPEQVCRLEATMAELKKDAQDARIRNDAIMDKLREAQSKDRQLQGPSKSHLPSHKEMGGHRHCASTAGGRPSFPTTPGETQGPPALSPYVSQPPRAKSHRLSIDPTAYSSADC